MTSNDKDDLFCPMPHVRLLALHFCGRLSQAITAAMRHLNWRALDRTIGAEDAAIASYWPQHGSAVRAFIKIQAGIGRHDLDRGETAMRTGEDGFKNGTHDSSDGDVLDPDKLGLQHGFTIFQKHCNNFVQVVVDLIQRFALGMSTWEARNKTNEQASLLAPLNDR
jgi:hypothetical protein